MTPQLCALADRVQQYASALNKVDQTIALRLIERYVRVDVKGSCLIQWDMLRLRSAVIYDVLNRVLTCVSGRVYSMRFRVLDLLPDRIKALTMGLSVTAGGCVLMRVKKGLLVVREWKRVPSCVIPPKQSALFDGRFCVMNAGSDPVTLYAAAQKRSSLDPISSSLPIFVEKESIQAVSLVPCRGEVYGYFAPRTPLVGARL